MNITFEVDPDVTQVLHPPRKVPVAVKKQLKAQLEKLTNEGVLAPVTPRLVSSMVTVISQGKMIICIDPRDLKSTQKKPFPHANYRSHFAVTGQCKVFRVLDTKNGFWHVQLDEESSYLTTFNTLYGRYRWLKMPFGIDCP